MREQGGENSDLARRLFAAFSLVKSYYHYPLSKARLSLVTKF